MARRVEPTGPANRERFQSAEKVGIDVEVVRPMTRAERLARRVCTDREIESLEGISEADRDTALLRLWTCKEAGLKAIGTGLRGGMRNVEVDLKPGGTMRLRQLCGELEGWTLLTVDIKPHLLCTIVIRGEGWQIVTRRWQPSTTGGSECLLG